MYAPFNFSAHGDLIRFIPSQPAIFEDIAQEALAYCRTSLVAASDLIRSRKPSGILDGSLFLVRHLLILKEVISSLDESRLREEGSGLRTAEKERDKWAMSSARASEFGGLGAVRGALVGGGVTGAFFFIKF